ncbi:Werner Syndrome-like exonuclease [Vigna radiata var. radiata]|uniref:Werner Syndrome-like exonuclease n=1 Tax=Vigna radiata var. radiata TaxID=3916 RepID=A0A1S3TFR1_VIGRR|nr:Werner Syndrome-like exonuclease [Vigna radiata var. radiata]
MENHNRNCIPPLNISHRNLYNVTFHSDTILTLLTSNPSEVHCWISDILRCHYRRSTLLVGLDIEWRPNFRRNMNNPVATLQLCVGRRCIVFQILHAPFIPLSLVSFLGDANNTFMGVGIQGDVQKLLEDCSLRVANFLELGSLAVEKLGDPALNTAGLKTLGLRVLGLEVDKPKKISRSRWDNGWLSDEQVQYAAIDAFVSFEIGRRLSS